MSQKQTAFKSFFSLIRIQNLFFIVLTQYCFYFLVANPIHAKETAIPVFPLTYLNWLVLASVSIAAAGYVINDYFDLNIDRINKPEKLVIDRFISRRWAMFLHLLLSFLGILISGWLSFKLNNPFLLAFNLLSVVLLFVYSSTFKKKLLSGNLIISALTAWVIFVIFVAAFQLRQGEWLPDWTPQLNKIYRMSLVYGGFAFVVSLIREVVKDMEDEIGDQKNGCKTMPIVWGAKATKVFVGVWMLVLFGILLALMVNMIITGWLLGVAYIGLMLLPYLYIIFKQFRKDKEMLDFAARSRQIKIFMLLGILSMFIFYYYN
jgi:4-hydroxybenzoate polyprenyltransferase